jgi:translation initiation factor IF-2
MQTEVTQKTERSPIVAIMGHIDHGKSTLLSYIRKSTKPLNEAGGITQHISAYEVDHVAQDGKKHVITFIDTPGHEAFCGIRKRGASVADIAVLVVSAEDGVKPQTLEALASITESNTPYIIAINKIDKPGVNIEKTKQNLLESGIYVEGYGGDIPCIPLSAKTGEGVPELLDMIILVAELENLTGNKTIPATGMIIESNRDIQKGISATCIIKDGYLEKGMYVASGLSTAPIRIMENYLGKPISTASFSSPIKVIGWDTLPEVGANFVAFKDREEAREYVLAEKERMEKIAKENPEEQTSLNSIRIVLKADTGSSLEALTSEIKKLATERTRAQIIASGIGAISENDVRLADGSEKAIVIGFHVKIDSPAKNLAERNEIEIQSFDIIYKMNEWLKEVLVTRTPKMQVTESTGRAKILKLFSKVKDRQIVGGRVDKGLITVGAQVKIIRNDIEIGEGKIRELQQQKLASEEVREGKEFGSMISSNIEFAPGDYIEAFITSLK